MSEAEKTPLAAGDELEGGRRIKEVIPMAGMRKAMSEHSLRSLREAAQMSQMGNADVSGLVKYRQELLAQEAETGVRYTYTDMIVKIIAEVLKYVPMYHCSVIGDQIVTWDKVNIGMAVAYEPSPGVNAVVVPVLRDADTKSLLEVHNGIQDLVGRARNRRLRPSDVVGATFTYSNIGVLGGKAYDVGYATVVLNEGQSGLLMTGPIMDEAVVRDGQIVIRPMMKYTLTNDHRVVVAADSLNLMSRFEDILLDPRSVLES